jgi:SAM-dependent MidA family methyltransferase
VSLREKIVQEIREHGPMLFSRYMEKCLYDPELGYYSRGAERFGKAGDFYTSSDVHAVFGRLLARQFEEMWRALDSPAQIEIREFGPGRGLFARDVLDWSQKKFPDFFAALHYRLVERSPALRQRLHTTLNDRISAGKATVVDDRWAGLMGSPAIPVIVFANEFFDALPVEVLSEKGTLRIDVRENRLIETWAPASAEALEFVDRYSVHPQAGERVEVCLAAMRQMSEISASITRGFFVTVDYGYTREEQLAGRHQDTVMAYREHSATPNPYEAPGGQDITAHVNFTALAAAAAQPGMRTEKLVTQSQFLMGIGEANQFADAFEECRLPQERAKVALQLKHLITPAGLGETFHVLLGSKDVDAKTMEGLSGMCFGKNVR